MLDAASDARRHRLEPSFVALNLFVSFPFHFIYDVIQYFLLRLDVLGEAKSLEVATVDVSFKNTVLIFELLDFLYTVVVLLLDQGLSSFHFPDFLDQVFIDGQLFL